VSSEQPPSPSGASLVVRPPRGGALVDDVKMQHLWLNLQKKSWRSLALVSASKGVATLDAANSLAKIAWWFTGVPTCVFDMRDLSLRLLEHQLRDMASQLNGGERIFIALRSTAENPTAVPLAQAADAAVLCVELGKTDAKAAQRTLDAVGRQRFLGTLLVPPEGKRSDKKAESFGPPSSRPSGPSGAGG
jgi:hypothetical protein